LAVVVAFLIGAAGCGSGPQDSTGSVSTALSTNAESETQYRFEFIDIPGSVRTIIWDINNVGTAVGVFTDQSNILHGIIVKYHKTTIFDIPGSSSTSFTDINDSGVMVGWFNDVSGFQHGFRLSSDMSVTVVDFPGAANTYVGSINNRGDMTGGYGPTIDEGVGFLLQDGHFTSLADPPGAAPLATFPLGINNSGAITGGFSDAYGTEHGFVLRGTTYTVLDSNNGGSFTEISKINDSGKAFGWNDAGGFIVTTQNGNFSAFACPDGLPIRARGINNRGQLTGGCRTVAGGPFHGFIATPVEE